jgi:OOP family OmpA-OmpF porin
VVTDSSGECVRTSAWSEAVPCKEPEQVAKAEPPPPVAPPAPKRLTLSDKTLFDFDRATLRPEGKQALDQAIAQIRSDLASVSVEERHITVTGHTDSTGTEAYRCLN